jgi:predicted anti-sigma-YlaC factor YlaD
MTEFDRCSEWRALASCRLDGELDESQAALLELHLLGCAACRSWTREIAALTDVFHDSLTACPVPSPELRAQARRRRLVRSVSAASAAASVAAAAVFAVTLPGAAMSLFSSGRTHAVSAAPCASCMKKRVLALAQSSPATARAPIHVAHPLQKLD